MADADGRDVLLIGQSDVARLLPIADAISVVEAAFRRYDDGDLPRPGVLGAHADAGGFHIKAATWREEPVRYFAAKVNANFPLNPQAGLPTIQGLVVLFDAGDGRPLAVLDSIEITVRRTAAATAVAAKYLARPESRTVALCGCGVQAMAQLTALQSVLSVERCLAIDIDPRRSASFAAAAATSGLHVEVASIDRALAESDVVVTCTTSRRPLFAADAVRPGTFVAAVGADNPEKQELDPALLARATVVVDILDQCAEIGELHHALASGAMSRDRVHAELGALASRRSPGRRTAGEITIFDSTGTALQDAAAAAAVYERARRERRCRVWAPSALDEAE
jgi:ornithine cyclodeaminase/alanine dehydrogenase-like protein (mu-crystallin family)